VPSLSTTPMLNILNPWPGENKDFHKNMLDSDHIENALLIHGPTGTGKTTNCQKICKSPLKEKPTTTKNLASSPLYTLYYNIRYY
jgi:DNA polymerase III delta prime subunit